MHITRRGVLVGGGGLAAAGLMPAWAQPVARGITKPLNTVSGAVINLTIAEQMLMIDGKHGHALGINGTVPGPLVRLREGQDVVLRVTNQLDEDSSIHWHGLLVPMQYDGVPGVSFPGIAPKTTFEYRFPLLQAGTYWYHSHSGLQEQMGVYGPIVIDPKGADPVRYDREHVIVLSDYSPLHAHSIYKKLKQLPGYFNHQKQTLAGQLAGRDQPGDERIAWGQMRMDPTDISDVTGSTYTFLANGYGPEDNWTALFTPGERVRLRFINAAAMTTFNVRIPGLPLTIVQADGLNVRPIEVDEFQFAPAETYDVIVTPGEDRAYTLVGEAIDRSGMAGATLAPRAGMIAPVPPLRERPVASMKDMGMGDMDHGADHGGMDMSMRNFDNALQVKRDPSVQSISPMPVDRMGDPGQGLENAGHRVLTYRQLESLDRNPDVRAPDRSIDLHLTGNMERYMWSFDGVRFSEAPDPLAFTLGERVRVNLINDTMMGHPIHLHGHFFELVTGKGDHAPRKHTVLVQPGGIASFDFTADAEGDWAFHCHMLYHMHAGMMRVVTVRPAPAGEGG